MKIIFTYDQLVSYLSEYHGADIKCCDEHEIQFKVLLAHLTKKGELKIDDT